MQGDFRVIGNEFERSRLLDAIKALDLGKRWAFKLVPHKPNTWPMHKTWRKWMDETAEFMRANGVTMPEYLHEGKVYGSRPFTEQDAHEAFIKRWLGVDDQGNRYKTSKGDRAKMLHAMDQHIAWATERGLFLTIPDNGEYMKLKSASEQ